MTDIEQLYLDRIEGMRKSLIAGVPFDDAFEMLPAEPRPAGQQAGSAPASDFPSQALTGTPLSNSNFESLKFDGGFDGGCVVNYFGHWTDAGFFELLDDLKSLARVYQDRGEDFFHDFDGVKALVLPFGSNKGVNFKYLLKWNGFTILIRGGSPSVDLPAVQIDFSYEVFRGRSLFEARFLIEDVLVHLGFKWDRVTFQRIDINVTLNESFSQVELAFREGRFLTRLRRFNAWGNNTSKKQVLNYIAGGTHKSEVSVVLYDKLFEVTNHYNEQKFDDIQPILNGGADCTRVEFRLTSAFFRTLDCFSFERLEELMPSVVWYLVSSWFRILKTKKVRGKENRQELDLFWQKVQYAFFKTFINSDGVKKLERKKTNKISNMRLLRQAVGCVSTAFAKSFDGKKDFDQFCADVFDVFLRFKRLSYKSYVKKRRLYVTTICQT